MKTMMVRMIFSCLCLLWVLPWSAAGEERPLEVPQRFEIPSEWLDQEREQFFGAYAFGEKIGWGVMRFGIAQWKDEDVYRGEFSHTMSYRVSDDEVIEAVMQYVECFSKTAPYEFVGGKSLNKQGDFHQTVELDVIDGRTKAVVTDGSGGRSEVDLGELDYTYNDFVGSDYWLEQLDRKEGDAVSIRGYDFEEFRYDTERYIVKAITGDEGEKRVIDVKIISDQVKMEGKWQYGGPFLSLLVGGEMELKVEEEAVAKDVSPAIDLFEVGLLTVNQGLGLPEDVMELELKITGSRLEVLTNNAMQSVETLPGGETAIVRVGVRFGKPLKATEEGIQRGLSETTEFPISDPRIQAAAKEAVGDAVSDREKANRILKYVYEKLEPTEIAEPLTVIDVLTVMQGDCSEASMLFTALARASGIPTRTVGGLIYMGDDYMSFGGHAWNEVVINGNWVPIDPSWGERLVNATHISLDPEDMGAIQGSDWKLEVLRVKSR